MPGLFPPNNKHQIMETRDEEHFEVLYAYTNRYRDSSMMTHQEKKNRQ